MDLSYPDDSYPGSDVSYPLFDQFVPNPLVDSYPITCHIKFVEFFFSEKLLKTIEMHARTRKVYVILFVMLLNVT